MNLSLPVRRFPTTPKESGKYLCQERGSTRLLVLAWCVEARQVDWRYGTSLIHVSTYAGPIPAMEKR